MKVVQQSSSNVRLMVVFIRVSFQDSNLNPVGFVFYKDFHAIIWLFGKGQGDSSKRVAICESDFSHRSKEMGDVL